MPLVRSFVLRLLDDQLRDGRVVGRVHDVETGTEAVVRDAHELLDFLTAPEHHSDGSTPVPRENPQP